MSLHPQKHILSLAAQILLQNGCQPLNVRVSIRGGLRGSTRLSFLADEPNSTFAPFGSAGDTEMNELLVSCFLNELERSSVIALAGGPLSSRAISMRLGLGEEVPTKLKNYLTGLAERGVLTVARDGYALADQRFAEVAKLLARAQEPPTGAQPTPTVGL